MTAQRTSNKQILEAINGLTQAITATLPQNAAPAVNTAPVPEPPVITPLGQVSEPVVNSGETDVKVPESYLNHMTAKVQATANDKGVSYVMYARHNQAGETKLAYATADRWSSLKDRGLIGAIKAINPA